MAGIDGEDRTKVERLGYLGLGMMGFPMSQRLLKAGYEVMVWNRSAGKDGQSSGEKGPFRRYPHRTHSTSPMPTGVGAKLLAPNLSWFKH